VPIVKLSLFPRPNPDPACSPCLQAHANLANALQQLGSLDLALMYYQSALRLRPGFTDALTNMAAAYLQKGAVAQVGSAGVGQSVCHFAGSRVWAQLVAWCSCVSKTSATVVQRALPP
jgi:tetratricopeptide (TPR) repeat protein